MWSLASHCRTEVSLYPCQCILRHPRQPSDIPQDNDCASRIRVHKFSWWLLPGTLYSAQHPIDSCHSAQHFCVEVLKLEALALETSARRGMEGGPLQWHITGSNTGLLSHTRPSPCFMLALALTSIRPLLGTLGTLGTHSTGKSLFSLEFQGI